MKIVLSDYKIDNWQLKDNIDELLKFQKNFGISAFMLEDQSKIYFQSQPFQMIYEDMNGNKLFIHEEEIDSSIEYVGDYNPYMDFSSLIKYLKSLEF